MCCETRLRRASNLILIICEFEAFGISCRFFLSFFLSPLVLLFAGQRLGELEGVEHEKRRLDDLLRKGLELQTTLREDLATAREVGRRSVLAKPGTPIMCGVLLCLRVCISAYIQTPCSVPGINMYHMSYYTDPPERVCLHVVASFGDFAQVLG